MSTLYELTGEYLSLYELLSSGDIDEQIFEDSVEGIMFDERFEEKSESYAHVIKMLEADVSAVSSEITRLTARKKSFESNAKRLMDKLYTAMKQTGKLKFKTPLYSFSVQPSPPRVVVDNIEELYDHIGYWKPRKWDESELDKTKIKEALKAGEAIPGARLECGESLRIR